VKQLILFNYYHPQYLVTRIFTGLIMVASAACIGLAIFTPVSFAQMRNSGYKPTAIASGVDVNDILTDKDIPTGQKGFARDYEIKVQKDERLEIEVNSGNFDTVLSLLDSKGEVVAENDDAVGESSNSLIFFKVRQSGNYIVRVSSFGGSSGGKFTLKVNKLQLIK
jgi:hypothetical protein